MNPERLKNWLKEVLSWAVEPWLAFLCIIVMLIFITVCCIWQSEQIIRASGWVLQMIGMLLAIRGLLKVRAYFNQPTLRKLFSEWWYRFPKWKKQIVLQAEPGKIEMAAMRARVDVWTPDRPEDSLENRILAVVRNMERLKTGQRKNSEKIDELQQIQEKHQKEQEQSREHIENKIQSDLESIHTNDIYLSLIGLVWLTFGILLSTMSQELSNLF